LGDGPPDQGIGQMENLDFREKSPVKYQVKGTTNKYTVFTVPQNVTTQYWEYNGKEPVFQNLGFMPVFLSSTDDGRIVYTRFYRVYLPGYIISALTLVLIFYYYVRSYKRRRVEKTKDISGSKIPSA
jgi:hypothetical protein